MNTATKVSAFGLALALVVVGGWAVGRAVGPVGTPAEREPTEAAPSMTGEASLPGLAAAQNGYTLVADTALMDAGTAGDYRFRITDGAGTALTRFAVEHDKRLHLIVVRRDGAHFRHVHPEMAADGTWSVPLNLPAAGTYRVFADFRPEAGVKTTLGVDLQVAGEFRPAPDDGERHSSTVDDYQVRLDGDLTAGTSSTVRATISRQGQPVTDLQPYLGAYGHLVALRGSDLAYLHVHPEDSNTAAGPEVSFAVQVPTPGRYRLYLDFQHGGQVRTAEFVLDAAAGPTAGDGQGGHGEQGGHGGHGG